MHKKFLAVLASLAMALCLTACGVQITGISLPESLELEVGASDVLTVEYAADNASADALEAAAEKLTLVWTSDNDEVATVAEDGTVNALAPGEAIVNVATKDGKLSATCHITVTAPEEEIEPTKVAMDSDGMDALQAMKDSGVVVPENVDPETLTWASSDEAVATVDENGHITPVGTGECVITVTGAFLADDTAAASNMSYKGTANIVFLSATPKNEVATTQETEGNMWSAELRIVVCETLDEDGQEVDKTEDTDKTDKDTTNDKNTTTGDKNTGSNNGSTSTGGGTTNGGNNGGSTSTGGGNTSGGNNNAGTGNNPNEGGAAGGDMNGVVPGDGSWAVDGGDAEFDDGAVPPPPVSTPAPQAPADNAGTGNNPNEGGAAGGDMNGVVPGDGSWAVDGGDAEFDDGAVPPPPVI